MKIDSINQHCNVIISKIPTRTKVFNSFSHPCPVIDDALSDAWDRVFTNMLFDAFTVGVWDDIMTVALAAVTVGVDVGMVTDVKVTALLPVAIAL